MTPKIYPEFHVSIPREGDVWMHRGKGFISRGITRGQLRADFSIQESEVTHVEISCGEELSVRVWPFERIQMIDIRDKYAGQYLELVRARKITDRRKAARVAMWAVSNSNKDYYLSGIGAFLSKLFRQNTGKLFCSENCLFALWKEYAEILKNHPIPVKDESKCMPAHFNPAGNPDHEFFTVWRGWIPRPRTQIPVFGNINVFA